jgi:outer membrane protein OmpU
MRKLLLATTALAGVALIGTDAQAKPVDSNPIEVTVGGYVDFRAGNFNEDTGNLVDINGPAGSLSDVKRRHNDFLTEWKVNVDAAGKSGSVEYGGRVSFWNGSQFSDGGNGGAGDVRQDQAYVYLSSNYGKVILGDEHGASDLFVYAPTIGANQVDGVYTNFTDPTTLWVAMPTFVDNTEDSTKVTYYTPQLGNESHKVQLGASFAPNYADEGTNVIKYRNAIVGIEDETDYSSASLLNGLTGRNGSANAPYKNLFEFGAQYTGNWNPVNVVLSFNLLTADGESLSDQLFASNSNTVTPYRDFTLWGLGGQVMYGGFTVGGSYVDAGSYNTFSTQGRDQTMWTAGVTYGWNALEVGFSYLNGEGYNNAFQVAGATTTSTDFNYVKSYTAYGFGAAYTWFPGMSTNVDAVIFNQERGDFQTGTTPFVDNDGNVITVTQKLAF